MKIAEMKKNPPKVLMFGPFGTGKTALVTTLGKRLKLLDFDNGLSSAQTIKDKFTADRLDVDFEQFIDTDPKTATAFAKGKMRIMEIATEINQGKFKFQALGIDHLSAMAKAASRFIMGNNGKLDKGTGAPAPAAEIQHWSMMFTEVENILMLLRAMPIPVIVLAHDQRDSVTNLDTKAVKTFTEIGIAGKNMPNTVASYFDEVWYTKSQLGPGGKSVFSISTTPMNDLALRSRNQLPDGTNQDLGLVEIFRKLGFEFPPDQPPTLSETLTTPRKEVTK